jgi:hypothetical protein
MPQIEISNGRKGIGFWQALAALGGRLVAPGPSRGKTMANHSHQNMTAYREKRDWLNRISRLARRTNR